jgi:hypothetical protein
MADTTHRAVLRFQGICPELGVCSDSFRLKMLVQWLSLAASAQFTLTFRRSIAEKFLCLWSPAEAATILPKPSESETCGLRWMRGSTFNRSGNNVLALDLGMIRRRGEEILFCCVAGAGLDAQNQCIG